MSMTIEHISFQDVVDTLLSSGAVVLNSSEVIKQCYIEPDFVVSDGSVASTDINLAMEVFEAIEDDPRCSGYYVKTIYMPIEKLDKYFPGITYGKEDDGECCLCSVKEVNKSLEV